MADNMIYGNLDLMLGYWRGEIESLNILLCGRNECLKLLDF